MKQLPLWTLELNKNEQKWTRLCHRVWPRFHSASRSRRRYFAAVDMPEPINMANCIQHWTREELLPGGHCQCLLLRFTADSHDVVDVSGDLRQTVHCRNKRLLKSEKRCRFKRTSSCDTDGRRVNFFGFRWRLGTVEFTEGLLELFNEWMSRLHKM